MAEKPASLENEWSFGPDVPTYDFFEHRDVRIEGDREWLVNDLVYALEQKDFVRWEAVVCQELGLPLTDPQHQAVSDLLNFNDEPDEDRILYIDGIARPSRPWYEIVRIIAPHLLVETFKTSDVHYSVTLDGWRELSEALLAHGADLSLPAGVDQPIEVVPAELRHKLWLQSCFSVLSGLGQEPDMNLDDPEEHYRIPEFVEFLREHKESVAFLGLTLEKLLSVLILPPRDVPIFVAMLTEQLGLTSQHDPIADHLS